MDTLIQAIVVGIVQGLTEFLPVSSSAHLILVPRVLGWDDAFILSAAFDATLHLGTLVALVAYFWRDLWRYFVAFLRLVVERRVGDDADRKVALLLAISVIPGALLGVGLESFVDTFFRQQLLVVCVLLVVGAVILFVAERAARHTRDMEQLRPTDALGIGLAQALALFPGISRSGITISAGLVLGLKREAAARFSAPGCGSCARSSAAVPVRSSRSSWPPASSPRPSPASSRSGSCWPTCVAPALTSSGCTASARRSSSGCCCWVADPGPQLRRWRS
jgi:undecaprenyl-diphosphatase